MCEGNASWLLVLCSCHLASESDPLEGSVQQSGESEAPASRWRTRRGSLGAKGSQFPTLSAVQDQCGRPVQVFFVGSPRAGPTQRCPVQLCQECAQAQQSVWLPSTCKGSMARFPQEER